jgi:hypothetical protein
VAGVGVRIPPLPQGAVAVRSFQAPRGVSLAIDVFSEIGALRRTL